MIAPIIPSIALLGFAGFATRFVLRKQWRKAVICLLSGIVAFLVIHLALLTIQHLSEPPPNLDRERARINALEQRVSTLEIQLQKLQLEKAGK